MKVHNKMWEAKKKVYYKNATFLNYLKVHLNLELVLRFTLFMSRIRDPNEIWKFLPVNHIHNQANVMRRR